MRFDSEGSAMSDACAVEDNESAIAGAVEVVHHVSHLREELRKLCSKPITQGELRSTARDYLSIVARFLDEIGSQEDRGPLIQLIGGMDDLDEATTPTIFAKHKTAPNSRPKERVGSPTSRESVGTTPKVTYVASFERAVICAAVDVHLRKHPELSVEAAAKFVGYKVASWPAARKTKAAVGAAIVTWRKQLTAKGWEQRPQAREIYDSLRDSSKYSAAEAVLKDGARLFGLAIQKVEKGAVI